MSTPYERWRDYYDHATGEKSASPGSNGAPTTAQGVSTDVAPDRAQTGASKVVGPRAVGDSTQNTAGCGAGASNPQTRIPPRTHGSTTKTWLPYVTIIGSQTRMQLAIEAALAVLGTGRDGGAIAILGAGAGLRPEEMFGLDWPDVDLSRRVLTVRRVFTKGVLKPYGKTEGSRRRVPLRARVCEALDALPGPKRGHVFHGEQGARLHLNNWRRRDWDAAIEACGLPGAGETDHLTPYCLRHTYAAWSLAAGVNIFTLARRMGTSVQMIENTYGHLAQDADEYERTLLDAWDVASGALGSESDGRGSDVSLSHEGA